MCKYATSHEPQVLIRIYVHYGGQNETLASGSSPLSSRTS